MPVDSVDAAVAPGYRGDSALVLYEQGIPQSRGLGVDLEWDRSAAETTQDIPVRHAEHPRITTAFVDAYECGLVPGNSFFRHSPRRAYRQKRSRDYGRSRCYHCYDPSDSAPLRRRLDDAVCAAYYFYMIGVDSLSACFGKNDCTCRSRSRPAAGFWAPRAGLAELEQLTKGFSPIYADGDVTPIQRRLLTANNRRRSRCRRCSCMPGQGLQYIAYLGSAWRSLEGQTRQHVSVCRSQSLRLRMLYHYFAGSVYLQYPYTSRIVAAAAKTIRILVCP